MPDNSCVLQPSAEHCLQAMSSGPSAQGDDDTQEAFKQAVEVLAVRLPAALASCDQVSIVSNIKHLLCDAD